MNWGTKIVISLGLFVAFILAMSGYMWLSRNELIQNDYYERELKFQEEIDRKNNTLSLERQPEIAIDSASKSCRILFPIGKTVSGKLKFIRPSDKSRDFSMELKPTSMDSVQVQEIDLQNAIPGLWSVEVFWSADGKDYMNQFSVRI